jgi:hypothetical protein
MQKLAAIAKSKEIIPTRISFVDIAGLVRGASKGEGLGNQFLANIREVDAIVHVLRCFEDDDITHVEGRIDPVGRRRDGRDRADAADLESLERRIEQTRKRARQGQGIHDRAAGDGAGAGAAQRRQARPPHAQDASRREICDPAGPQPADLASGALCLQRRGSRRRDRQRAHRGRRGDGEGAGRANASSSRPRSRPRSPSCPTRSSANSSARSRPGGARPRPADPRRLRPARPHHLFHRGPKETRAWTIERGTKAPQAAGVIHTDFERGFIRAQTIAYDDYVALGGEVAAKEAGKARDEGKEYVVQDGDVLLFKFNT